MNCLRRIARRSAPLCLPPRVSLPLVVILSASGFAARNAYNQPRGTPKRMLIAVFRQLGEHPRGVLVVLLGRGSEQDLGLQAAP